MKKITMTALAVAFSAGAVHAGGVERADPSVGILFEQGRYVEFGFGAAQPRVSGTGIDATTTGVAGSGDLVPGFGTYGFAYKEPLNEKLDLAIIVNQPIGASSHYPDDSDFLLRGVTGQIKSTALTALLRYRMPNNLSVYGGLRIEQTSGSTTAPLAAYRMATSTETDLGYLLGVAWEKPEIGARVALTYTSKITHEFRATEQFGATTISDRFSMTVPESVNLEFQTGLNPKTLLLGALRWTHWTQFDITPPAYAGAINPLTSQPFGSLVSFGSNVTTLQLGLGRKFNESWSGAVMLGYEADSGDIMSNLGPTDGYSSITVAANWQATDRIKISGGVSYFDIGDARTAVGRFRGNHAWGAGLRIGMNF